MVLEVSKLILVTNVLSATSRWYLLAPNKVLALATERMKSRGPLRFKVVASTAIGTWYTASD